MSGDVEPKCFIEKENRVVPCGWSLIGTRMGVLQVEIKVRWALKRSVDMADDEEGVVDNWEDADTEVS